MKNQLLSFKEKLDQIVITYCKAENIPYSTGYSIDFGNECIDISWDVYEFGGTDYYGCMIPYEFLEVDIETVKVHFTTIKEKREKDKKEKEELAKFELIRKRRLQDYNYYLDLKKTFDGLSKEQVENDKLWLNNKYIAW